MSEDTIQVDSIEEVYKTMRENLRDTHDRLLEAIREINAEKKPAVEIMNNVLELCSLTYNTVDAMLQIQLGLIKGNENMHSNRQV